MRTSNSAEISLSGARATVRRLVLTTAPCRGGRARQIGKSYGLPSVAGAPPAPGDPCVAPDSGAEGSAAAEGSTGFADSGVDGSGGCEGSGFFGATMDRVGPPPSPG